MCGRAEWWTRPHRSYGEQISHARYPNREKKQRTKMTDETKTTTPEGAYPQDLPVVPLGVGREKSVAAINAAMAEERHLIVLVAQRDAEIDDVQPEQIYSVGTVAEIVRLL